MNDNDTRPIPAEKALRQRNRELALLNRASQALNATLELDEVFAIVLEEVRRLMGVTACSIWLLDPTTDELTCRQATGPQSDIVRGWRLEPGEGLAGWVVREGKSLIVHDARKDKRHFEDVGQQTGLALRSILSVPLKTKQHVIGVLQAMDTQVQRFNAEHLTLLELLAASAAIAIDNARLVEALRQRSAELEARNEDLSRLTYLASHNLRAPLVNLQGFTAELRSAFEIVQTALPCIAPCVTSEHEQGPALMNALTDEIPEALSFIDTAVLQMDTLVNALLELSHLSRRKLDLKRIDMNELVEEALQKLASHIEERQARVTLGPLPEVVADRTSMEQIIDHLLKNAVLYLDPQRPGEIEINGENNDHEATFYIHDNGRGIAASDMHKVFAPFRRAGQPDVPGQGMGLAYVQTLVRRHGGQITCRSEPDQGTTFTFTISNHLLASKR